jgi:ferric-dicitrate binding protein FerR (iron transport regulator)
MNRDEILRLLSAERDGALGAAERAELDQVLRESPEARALRAELEAALTAFRRDAEGVRAPDADEAWPAVQARLDRPAARRRAAPVAWFALPLAAAAAVAVAFLGLRPMPTGVPADPEAGVHAQADFVELADASATPVVFVDKESGWLVVWAETAEKPAE